MLEAIGRDIAAAYRAHGYTFGWTFLYSAKRTFRADQRVFFVGLNPGGGESKEYREILSVEEGNAYLHEDWGGGPGAAPLQQQVQALFRNIATAIGVADWRSLMDDSIAANIPFRSSAMKTLIEKQHALTVASAVWRRVFKHISPRVVIALTHYV